MLASLTGSSKSLRPVWCSTLQKSGITEDLDTANGVLQDVLDQLIPTIGEKVRDPITVETSRKCELSQSDKAVLHYAIGFIIRKLSKKFLKSSSNKAPWLE